MKAPLRYTTVLIKVIFILNFIILSQVTIYAADSGKDNHVTQNLYNNRREFNDINKKINKKKRDIFKAKQNEKKIISDIHKIDRSLDKSNKKLKLYNQNLEESEKKINKLNKEITIVEQSIEEQKNYLSGRLRSIYKQGSLSFLKIIFSAESPHSLRRRLHYMKMIAKEDSVTIKQMDNEIDILEEKKSDLIAENKKIIALKKDITQKRAEIKNQKKKKLALLKTIKNKKSAHIATLNELEEMSKNLKKMIAKLRKKEKQHTSNKYKADIFISDNLGFSNKKGTLTWPTKGRLASNYGKTTHPTFKTKTFNKGIIINAAEGQPVSSVYDGYVLYADWFKGYGKLIIIDHGSGYYSLYAHLSTLSVSVGNAVKESQVIAEVGDTDSLSGPSLYFEIRHCGKPINPIPWLNSTLAKNK